MAKKKSEGTSTQPSIIMEAFRQELAKKYSEVLQEIQEKNITYDSAAKEFHTYFVTRALKLNLISTVKDDGKIKYTSKAYRKVIKDVFGCSSTESVEYYNYVVLPASKNEPVDTDIFNNLRTFLEQYLPKSEKSTPAPTQEKPQEKEEKDLDGILKSLDLDNKGDEVTKEPKTKEKSRVDRLIKFKEEVEALQKKYNGLETKYEQSKEEKAKIQKELDATRKNFSELDADFQKKKEEINVIKSERDEAITDREKVVADYDALVGDIHDFCSYLDDEEVQDLVNILNAENKAANIFLKIAEKERGICVIPGEKRARREKASAVSKEDYEKIEQDRDHWKNKYETDIVSKPKKKKKKKVKKKIKIKKVVSVKPKPAEKKPPVEVPEGYFYHERLGMILPLKNKQKEDKS